VKQREIQGVIEKIVTENQLGILVKQQENGMGRRLGILKGSLQGIEMENRVGIWKVIWQGTARANLQVDRWGI
jgi:hypothetical protein